MLEQQSQIARVDNIGQRPASRPIPIAPIAVTTSIAGVYTSPERQSSALDGLVASNGTGGPLTLTLHVGAASGAVTIEALTIPANEMRDLSGLIMLAPGETLWAVASGAGIRVSGWAKAYL